MVEDKSQPMPSRERGIAAFFQRRLINAATYSWRGLVCCFRNEEAFRFELFIGGCLLPVAFIVAESTIELCLLLGSMLVVLIVELLNSAIEAAVDLNGVERTELAGRAKDQGSAAVLLGIVLFALVWGLIIGQRWLP